MPNFLISFLEAFFLTIFFIGVVMTLAKKIDWKNIRRSKRHIHRAGVHRVGGCAMVVAFNLAIALNILNKNLVVTPELLGFMIASVFLMLVGIRDDVRELFWKTQLFFQMILSLFIFIVGVRIYYITNPLNGGIINLDSGATVLISLALVVFWVVFVINAVNWIDGVDGLSSGIALISVGTIFFLSFRPEVNQPAIGVISIILMGVFLGFLIFNFNPARVMAGTTGSMFMGFSLAVLAIFSGTKIATATLVLAIPFIDFLWVIGERIKNKKMIFKPDNNHLHHKLLEIGWSQRKISICYYAITIAIAFVALNTRMIGKSIALIFSAFIMLLVFFVVNRRLAALKEKKEI